MSSNRKTKTKTNETTTAMKPNELAAMTALFAVSGYLEMNGVDGDSAAQWPMIENDSFDGDNIDAATMLAGYVAARQCDTVETIVRHARSIGLMMALDPIKLPILWEAALQIFADVVLAVSAGVARQRIEEKPAPEAMPDTPIEDTIFAQEEPMDTLTDAAKAMADLQAKQPPSKAGVANEADSNDVLSLQDEPDENAATDATEPTKDSQPTDDSESEGDDALSLQDEPDQNAATDATEPSDDSKPTDDSEAAKPDENAKKPSDDDK